MGARERAWRIVRSGCGRTDPFGRNCRLAPVSQASCAKIHLRLMTVLPIVERELRVASRRRATYRMRVTAALAAMATFGWIMLTFLQTIPSTWQGRYLFRVLFGLAFVYCLLIGARLTADCLSEEKREGTLGLLFLTDLKGYDVVFGKLAATSLHVFYAMLAIFPVLAVPLLMGGVTAGEFWRLLLVLVATLLFSLSIGMLSSALNRE